MTALYVEFTQAKKHKWTYRLTDVSLEKCGTEKVKCDYLV